MTDPRPHIVARRTEFEGWNRLEVVTVEALGPTGRIEKQQREVIDHGSAAVVLAVDRSRNVAILVRQWRAPLIGRKQDPFLLEACAGIIDPGEAPEQSARREAEEEIGFRIEKLRHVADVYPSAGTLTEKMHLFLADVSAGDRSTRGGGKEGEGENIEVVDVPLADLFAMARAGRIDDAKTLILVQALMLEGGDGR